MMTKSDIVVTVTDEKYAIQKAEQAAREQKLKNVIGSRDMAKFQTRSFLRRKR